jgi:hypothetical protein
MGKPGPCLIDFRVRAARTKVTACNRAGMVMRESIKQGSLLAEYIGQVELTRRTETSQYPEEQKATAIPRVVASEMGAACTM